MKLNIGELVISQAGNDSGRIFAVIGVTEEHLILADGRSRRLEKPKLKKVKHVKPLGNELEPETRKKLLSGELTNKMLYRGIKKSLV